LLIAFLLFKTSKGQYENVGNELCISCAKLTFDFDTHASFEPSFLSVLMYKQLINRIGYRLGFDISSLHINSNEPKMFGSWYDIKKNKLATQIGLQRTIYDRKKSQFYYGIDLVYSYTIRKENYYSKGDWPPYNTVTTINTKHHSIGCSPLLGFNYSITQQLSVNGEFAFFAGYFIMSGKAQSFAKKQGSEYNISPLNRLAICYRF
jgi:hypothetical protein